jgi:aminopeptidase N
MLGAGALLATAPLLRTQAAPTPASAASPSRASPPAPRSPAAPAAPSNGSGLSGSTTPFAHADFDLRLEPAARRLIGRVDWRLPVGGPLSLVLDRALRIDEVLPGDGLAAPLIDHDERGRWRLRVAARSRAATLRVRWSGTLAPIDPSIDHRRVLGALPAMLSAEGGWLPAGSAWYPEPGVPFTYRVAVDGGAQHRALVPGRITGALQGTANTRATFESHAPEEGLTLMSGPWVVTVREPAAPESPRLLTWFTPASQSLADTYLDAAGGFIARFAKRMGPYPFDAFSIVAAPLPAGFALPGLTWVGERLLPLPFMRGQSLAHEIAHNWWGNGVRVDTRTGNWSEGLVTWLADHALRAEQSSQAARRMRWGWLREQATLDPKQDMPLSRFLMRTQGASATVGYGRAAMLFHMVAADIGEPAFDRALRALMGSHLGRRAGWRDLQAAFERASGRSLETLLPPMTGLVGAPTLGPVSARWTPDTRTLLLRLAQRAPYGTAARVRVRTAQGTQDVQASLIAGADQVRLTLSSGLEPQSIQFDPQYDLWRALAPSEQPALLRDVQQAPRVQWMALAPKADWEPMARELATRLLESAPSAAPSGSGRIDEAVPLLIAGTPAAVAALAAREPALARPADLGEPGEVELWAARSASGTPRLIVAAETTATLQRLLPRLAHYGGEGYVSFRAGRVAAQGVGAFEPPTVAVSR